MSNRKDSPIVGTTVVKKSGSASDDDSNQKADAPSNNASGNDTNDTNDAHYDSFAELKKATNIVDADGNPIDDESNNEEAQKKAKLRDPGRR